LGFARLPGSNRFAIADEGEAARKRFPGRVFTADKF